MSMTERGWEEGHEWSRGIGCAAGQSRTSTMVIGGALSCRGRSTSVGED